MIDKFSGKYKFLCNFYRHPLEMNGKTYPTLEHAYQAVKSRDPVTQDSIRKCPTPLAAKRLGHHIRLREDWEESKVDVMEILLRTKFQDPDLQKRLLDTYPHTLIEGNWWGDTFWGMKNGKGQNHLGNLLMKIRGELREDRFIPPQLWIQMYM